MEEILDQVADELVKLIGTGVTKTTTPIDDAVWALARRTVLTDDKVHALVHALMERLAARGIVMSQPKKA